MQQLQIDNSESKTSLRLQSGFSQQVKPQEFTSKIAHSASSRELQNKLNSPNRALNISSLTQSLRNVIGGGAQSSTMKASARLQSANQANNSFTTDARNLLSINFDDMMEAQNLLLHGQESREFQNLPKVLELVLRLLEKRALVPSEQGFSSLFLQTCQDYEMQIKKLEALPLQNNNGKLIKLQVLSPRTDFEESKEPDCFETLHMVRE